MPHIDDTRYAVASCHVERPLDDRVWSAFSRLQQRAPGGFRIAALMRPPADGEDAARWLERAREAAARGPLGHHTHFGGADRARPTGEADPAARVRSEAAWLRDHGFEPRLFCAGGWYMDGALAAALAELGYADCSATAFRPSYLAPGTPRLALAEPAWLRVDGGARLLELPSTHSLGMSARAALTPLPRHVHVYFHDTDLLSRPRRLALQAALALLGRRRRPIDLEQLRSLAERSAAERPFTDAVAA
jgi:hypothetical protein